MSIVLISYTPLDAGGGVPRWNRDFVSCFPGTKHYSWSDVPGHDAHAAGNWPEWDRARILARYLLQSKKVTSNDIVIADGFWADGYFPDRTVCVRHGIWSHLTKEMADAGMQPEFPAHHAVQVDFTRRHLANGGKIVAVSDFIARQCKLQWGFEMGVINNAIDLEKFRPADKRVSRKRPIIIHGVTTANKGIDHIDLVRQSMPFANVLLLDEAAKHLGLGKYEALAQADLVVQPSAYEGNSYFILETLACNVPLVAYNVGLLNSLSEICQREKVRHVVGCIIDRKLYSPQETAKVSRFILDSVIRDRTQYNPREVAELFSIQRFGTEWRSFLRGQFGNVV